MLEAPPQDAQVPDEKADEKALAKIPKLFRVRRTQIGLLYIVVQNGSLKSQPKGIDPKLQCTVKVEGGAGETEPMAASKQEWNTEFQFPVSEYSFLVDVSLNTSRVDLVTQETRWIKEATTSFEVVVKEEEPWKEAKNHQLQLKKGGKGKPIGTVNLSVKFVPRKNRFLKLEKCILSSEALAKALLTVDTGIESQQEYAKSLLLLFWYNGRERDLIRMCVHHEIFIVFEKMDDITQLLRGPTLSAMVLSEYMHIICDPYLAEVVVPLIRPLAQNPQHFELDPSKLDPTTADKDLKRNQKGMNTIVNKFLKKIASTANKLPPDMGDLCRLLKSMVAEKFPDNPSAWTIAMGALIFLRFICPAIVAPDDFGLIQSECGQAGRRCLVLVSKILTNLVNNVEFGSKEVYMTCMNPFLEKHKAKPVELYNNILKRKEGFLLELKVAQRGVEEETYTKLWKVIDRVGDRLADSAAEVPPEFKQTLSQIREAEQKEQEEKEAAERAAEAKLRKQQKRKDKSKEPGKDNEKDAPESDPGTPKDPRKSKGREERKNSTYEPAKKDQEKEGSTIGDDQSLENSSTPSPKEPTAAETKLAASGDGAATSNTNDPALEGPLKSPKGKKKTDSPLVRKKNKTDKKDKKKKRASLKGPALVPEDGGSGEDN